MSDAPADAPDPEQDPKPGQEEGREPRAAAEPKGCRRRILPLLLLFIALLAAPPTLFWGAGHLFFNTPLGPRLLSGSGARTSLDWRGGHSWIPGRIHVEGFRLEGKTPRGRWLLEIDRADLRHQLAPLFDRTFLADRVEARGATFSWTSFERPVELPPRRVRSGRGWKLVFPQIEIEGVRRLHFDGNEVDAAARPGKASGAFELEIRHQTSVPRFELEIADAVIDRKGEALARLMQLRLAGRLDPYEPKKNRGVAALRYATSDIELRTEEWNLAALSSFFRGLPVRLEGRGALDAHLQIDRGVLMPTSHLIVHDGRLQIDYLHYRARGTGGLKLEGDPGQSRSTLTATLDSYTFGRIGEPPHVEGDRLSLIGSGPPLDLTDPEPQYSAELRISGARVPDFAAFDDAIPPGVPLQLRSGEGRMALDLNLDPETYAVAGRVEIEGQGVEAEIHNELVAGHVRLRAELEKGEIETRRFELGHVSLELDEVAAEGLADWWARLQIEGGEVTLGQPLQLAGETTTVLRDARPLAALMSDHAGTVSWLRRLLDEKSVRASAFLRLEREALSLTELDVAGGRRLRTRGDLLLADDEVTGLLLVELGRLAAAAELLPGGERDFKLLGARDWFHARRAVEAARRDADRAREGPDER